MMIKMVQIKIKVEKKDTTWCRNITNLTNYKNINIWKYKHKKRWVKDVIQGFAQKAVKLNTKMS